MSCGLYNQDTYMIVFLCITCWQQESKQMTAGWCTCKAPKAQHFNGRNNQLLHAESQRPCSESNISATNGEVFKTWKIFISLQCLHQGEVKRIQPLLLKGCPHFKVKACAPLICQSLHCGEERIFCLSKCCCGGVGQTWFGKYPN